MKSNPIFDSTHDLHFFAMVFKWIYILLHSIYFLLLVAESAILALDWNILNTHEGFTGNSAWMQSKVTVNSITIMISLTATANPTQTFPTVTASH